MSNVYTDLGDGYIRVIIRKYRQKGVRGAAAE
jgi:hypothetical protein